MIKTIGVIGSGTMGHGIAETFALHGYTVFLYDTSADALTHAKKMIGEELALLAEEALIKADAIKPAMARISFSTDLAESARGCDYIIEAAPERMDLKQALFKQLDEICKPDCIFASNTTSLPLSEMSKLISDGRKKRIMVNHWYNPPHIMPLVELSFFGNMPEAIYAEVAAMYAKVKKQTVKVLKDIPGMVANRLQQGVAREAFWLIQNGVADPADIDKALKFGPAFRYATTGQLEVADFGGLDIWCVAGDNLLSVMDNAKEANPILRAKVKEGKLGVKSGEGFFVYPSDKVSAIREHFMRKLIHQLKASEYYA